jgi:itaconate CoA-transferase
MTVTEPAAGAGVRPDGVGVGPLAGVTVVGLEQAIAAPLATRHMADLGARVIKIEQPGVGDGTRYYDTTVKGQAAHFVWLNHGKESAELDLKAAADMAVLRGILASADVFVSNLAPGALARLGLAPEELARRYPRLVIVDVSGYGKGGPSDHKRAYDLLIQAESGACALTGSPEAPAKPGPPVADVATSLYVYSTVLAALLERTRTGRGAVIEISMLDVMGEVLGFALNQAMHTGEDPPRVGMGNPMIAPYGAYPTADGQTAVLGTTSDREFVRLAGMLGRPELAEDPRYATTTQRVAHRGEVDAFVGQWCRERSLAEVQEAADAAGIGNAALRGVGEFARNPQLSRRGRWRDIDTPAGPVPMLLPPGLASHWQAGSGPVPALGEHTEAVRQEFGTAGDAASVPAPGADAPAGPASRVSTASQTHTASASLTGAQRTAAALVVRSESRADALAGLLGDRHSCRAFLPEQVPTELIERLLRTAQRSASWCNTQPWQAYVTRGEGTERLREALMRDAGENPGESAPDFPAPAEYRDVYRDRRRASGWALYDAVGVAKGDREASAAQAAENFRLFGAPHAAIITTDAAQGVYGAVDCGLYIGTFLLAAESLGLACIPQAALAMRAPVLREHFGIPEDRQIVAGISFGYEDTGHAANSYRTERAGLEEVVTWVD